MPASFEKTPVFRRRRFSEKYKSSARKYQISDTPTSRGYARQAHHLLTSSESLQLATYRSVAFVVTNSSLYVDGAICAVSEERRVRNYEAPAPVCRQLNGLRSDRSVVDLSRVRSGFGQSRSLVPPVLTTCSFLKNDVF